MYHMTLPCSPLGTAHVINEFAIAFQSGFVMQAMTMNTMFKQPTPTAIFSLVAYPRNNAIANTNTNPISTAAHIGSPRMTKPADIPINSVIKVIKFSTTKESN